MEDLRIALANIHNDRQWAQKLLIGGALMLTLIGYPLAAGLAIDSLDNIRKGFPTPLPPWRDWFTRYILGLFALLIDFVFFVLPTLLVCMLFFCVVALFIAREHTAVWLVGGATLLAVYELIMFAIGVSPVGRLLYVEEGSPERALSIRTLRLALAPASRRAYARARLLSLPAYLPALVLGGAAWLALSYTAPGVWLAGILLLWLAASALLYAHLVVVQLYGMAERMGRAW